MVSEIQSRTLPLQPAVVATPDSRPQIQSSAQIAQKVSNITPIPKAEVKVNTEQMRANLTEAITRLNEVMRDGGRGLNFAVDHVLGAPIVLVRNSDTGEVIRQIPNEVVVRVAHSIEALKGMLHNQTT
jgi:flagellar protein FlaG